MLGSRICCYASATNPPCTLTPLRFMRLLSLPGEAGLPPEHDSPPFPYPPNEKASSLSRDPSLLLPISPLPGIFRAASRNFVSTRPSPFALTFICLSPGVMILVRTHFPTIPPHLFFPKLAWVKVQPKSAPIIFFRSLPCLNFNLNLIRSFWVKIFR